MVSGVGNVQLAFVALYKRIFLMLTLLIPRLHDQGKDMNDFLRSLVDELKQLWKNRIETRDAVDDRKFKIRAALLWTVNDFPDKIAYRDGVDKVTKHVKLVKKIFLLTCMD